MKPEIILFIAGRELVITSYPLFLALAIALTILLFTLGSNRLGKIPVRKILPLLVMLLFIVPLGARILNICLNYDYYIKHSSKIWALKTTGFSLYGGLMAGATLTIIYLKKFKLDIWASADAAALALGPGIALMRIGCFLNGCCFGQETSMPWAVSYPSGTDAHLYQQIVSFCGFLPGNYGLHPTQIYEMLVALCCSGIALWLIRKKIPQGIPFLTFVLIFTSFRFINMSLRVMPSGSAQLSYFYPILYGCIILWTIIMLWHRKTKGQIRHQSNL